MTNESWAKQASLYIVSHDQLSPDFIAKLRHRFGKENHVGGSKHEFIPTYLANLRYSRGWSRMDLVRRLRKYGVRVHPETMTKYETGKMMPHERALKALAAIYEISLPYLIKKLHGDLQPGVKDRRKVTDERADKLSEQVNEAYETYDYRLKDLYAALKRRDTAISYGMLHRLIDGSDFIIESDYKPLMAQLRSVIHMAKNKCY